MLDCEDKALHKVYPTLICLTPIKNEAWILERFLKCASLWANHIIIADQNSDDGSVEIVKRFAKVILVRNTNPDYNEKDRQRLLIESARKIPMPRLLIALDVDEFLTPNFLTSPEWQTMLSAPKGTVICFQWANICPDMRRYWTPPFDFPLGFHDDGSPHEGRPIHSARIPLPANAPTIKLRDVKVMHYQYTNWERMESKHRWYQCWERINHPDKSAISIFREYHHMYAVKDEERRVIPDEWFEEYIKRGIDMKNVRKEQTYYWDREVLSYIERYGNNFFAKEAIWDINWKEIAHDYGYNDLEPFEDPRSPLVKKIQSWLYQTQPHTHRSAVRLMEKFLHIIRGW